MPAPLRRPVVLFAVLALIALPGASRAGLLWNIQYDDVTNHTGVGFDDPTFGATRRATLSAVTNYIGSVVNENGSIDLQVQNSLTGGTGALAFAGPFFSGQTGYDNGAVFEHATTGVDPFGPSFPDAQATFDFGYNWNSGLGAPGGSQFDLFSVSLHELTHSLGFLSLVTQTGVSAITGTNPGEFSVFDSFLVRGNGAALFGPGGTFLGTAADLVSNDVFFNGPNAKAANGGNPVKVYSPTTWEEGSSISHIVDPNAVMQFSIPPGVERRQYLPLEVGVLQDIGWSIQPAAAPEPSSAVLLALVGAAGYVVRRRRRGADKTPTDLAV